MDKITVTVLEDGRIKIETEGINQVNHFSAENFVKYIETVVGGETQKQRKLQGQHQSQQHHHH